jgi:hypothetical protein
METHVRPALCRLRVPPREDPHRTVRANAIAVRRRLPEHSELTFTHTSGNGTYFSQHVGPASVFELIEYFLGPQPDEARNERHPDRARAGAEAAGLTVVDLRMESLHTEFRDIGAVVYFLRKVIWMVPGFTVEEYLPTLRALHEQIEAEEPFVATTTRYLIEASKS